MLRGNHDNENANPLTALAATASPSSTPPRPLILPDFAFITPDVVLWDGPSRLAYHLDDFVIY